MKNKENRKYLYQVLVLFSVVALGILLFFALWYLDEIKAAIGELIDILMPFIYGAVIAYILKPLCNFFERKFTQLFTRNGKNPQSWARKLVGPLSVTLSLVIGIAVVVALLILIIPRLIASLSGLGAQIEVGLGQFATWIGTILGEDNEITLYIEDFTENFSERLTTWIQDSLLTDLEDVMDSVTATLTNILGFFYNVLIGLIVSVYMLASRKKFAAQGKLLLYTIFKKKWADAIFEEIKFADRMFTGFISGRIFDSVIIGIICFVFNKIAGMPYALLIAVIVGVTNVIPFFGPFIGAIPSAILILMVSPVKCLIFIIFIIILQQFDGDVLGPKIVGNATGLPSFWVLFAVLVFGGLFGFVGMIVGVPLFAVIYDIVKKLMKRGLRSRGREDMIDEYRQNFPEKEEKRWKQNKSKAKEEERQTEGLLKEQPEEELPEEQQTKVLQEEVSQGQEPQEGTKQNG